MSVPTPRDAAWPAPPLVERRARPRARTSNVAREAEIATRWARLRTAVATSAGGRHVVNEDCHSALEDPVPLFVVADGVGGGARAAHASRELVTRLHAALDGSVPDAAAVRTALLDADRAIDRGIAGTSGQPGAATVALCTPTGSSLAHWLVAWVGDCRVYRLPARQRDGAELLTVDDTYRHLREAPPPGGSLDDPARMVGNGAVDAPNVRPLNLRAGDMLVLCSDGVHKHAAAGDIARLLREPGPLARRCLRLIELARARGSHDDATVLVVQRPARDLAPLARAATTGVLVALLALLAWLASDGMQDPGTSLRTEQGHEQR